MNSPKRIEIPLGWGLVKPSQTKDPKKKKRAKRRTLRRVFERILTPQLKAQNAAKATYAAYQTHLRGWERYWQERSERSRTKRANSGEVRASIQWIDSQQTQAKRRINDPPVGKITKAHLESFRRWLIAPGTRQTITVNNYMKSINTLMLAALDCEWSDTRPRIKRLKARKAARKIVLPYDHVDAIYRACERATWPRMDQRGEHRIDPVAHWRAAIVMWFVFGFRTQELVRYQSWMRSLTWGNFVWSSASPGMSNATNDHGWLYYVPQKQEGVKPEPLVLALPELVKAHLYSVKLGPIVDSTCLFSWPLNERAFRSQWQSICRASAVRPKMGIGVSKYSIKHLRKTATTWHNYHCPGIAPYIIGHADRNSVSDVHYNNPEMATTRALQNFPMPEAFNLIRKTDQLELF